MNAIKSGISTAIAVFLFTFLPAVLGWVSSMAEWASSSGQKPLPDISSVGYAAISAALAALAGVVWALFRWAQGRYKAIPGTPPTFG